MRRGIARFSTAFAYLVMFYGISSIAAIRSARASSNQSSDLLGSSDADTLQLTLVINLLLAFSALLIHTVTLGVGYFRWRSLSISMWLVGSIAAGLVGHPLWVGVTSLGKPAGSSTIQIAILAVASVATTVIVFELIHRFSLRASVARKR